MTAPPSKATEFAAVMAAFDGIRQEISGMTGIDVWIGTPN